MGKCSTLLFLAVLWLGIQCGAAEEAGRRMKLLPLPSEVIWQDGCFRVHESFNVAIKGQAEMRLCRAATRMLRRLSGRTGLFLAQDFVTPEQTVKEPSLLLSCVRAGKLVVGDSEAYTLDVAPALIRLCADSDIGVLRGLETLLQLLSSDGDGYFFPAVYISDRPRFPWRGLLIDSCRHFMPPDVILRNLDAMSAVKMNVLHWHLTEDQGFRVESKKFPRLHEMGADGFYYTQEQIREVIAYAGERGIRVMPEFDMPGHASSWFVGHPELASAPGPYTVERTFGVKNATMDPTREEVYQFLDTFLGEMAALFPDEYLHIGGDENNGKLWNANVAIQEFKKIHNIPDNHALQAMFNQRVLQILTKHGKKLVGWDEILHADMPRDIVIQSWRGTESLVQSAQQGYTGILSNGYYIDLIQATSFHYLNDPLPRSSPLSAEERQKILGGEATMWAELVTPENVDSRIWPRTAAIAERLWSPAHVRDVDDMYRRLSIISLQLEELGLCHLKNYEMMLRRLCRSGDIAQLKTLSDCLEPLKMYQRHFQGTHYTTHSPLTRVADVAKPDCEVARHLEKLVAAFLHDRLHGPHGEIEAWLVLWRDNHRKLLPVIRNSPVLTEIASLSQDLSTLAEAGLDALRALRSGHKPEDGWHEVQRALLARAKKPYAETELMVVYAIEKLILAVGKK